MKPKILLHLDGGNIAMIVASEDVDVIIVDQDLQEIGEEPVNQRSPDYISKPEDFYLHFDGESDSGKEFQERVREITKEIHKSPEPTEEDRFIMEYICSECGAEWEMAGSCSCNDHCPQCDAEITPTNVRDIE